MHRPLLLLAFALLLSGLPSCCLIGGCGWGVDARPPELLTKKGCVAVVHRSVATPSGDWIMQIDYGYDAQGKLIAVDSTLRTFHAWDEALEEARATTIHSTYDVVDGKLKLDNQSIRDVMTNKEVQRGFHDPEVSHWMTLEEAKRESTKEHALRDP